MSLQAGGTLDPPGDTRSEPAIEPAAAGGSLRRLLPFVMASKRDLVLALVASLVGSALFGVGPVVQKVIVDDAIVHHRRAAWPWLVALGAIAVVVFALAFVRRWYGGRVSLSVQHRLRTAIFDRLMRLDFAGHDRLRTGQLVSRSSSDLGLIQQLLAFTPIMLGNVLLVIVSLVAMVFLSPTLTLVAVVAIPVMAVVATRLRGTVFPATWESQQRAAEVAGVVDEAVTGVRIVKGFGAEGREVERLATASTSLYRSRVRLVRLQAKATSTLAAIPAFAQVVVLALGGWLAIHGRLSLGTFLAFSSYLVQLVPPVRMAAVIVAAVQQARAGAERVLDVLDANADVVDAPGAAPLPAGPGEVRFEGVRFGYQRSEPVLDGFDLHVRPGEVVALVGGSGSGKSTVTALLPRFYDVAAGRVVVDGADVREVTLASLRAAIGVVFEEAFLFSDSVRANIAYGRPDATDAEVRAAAQVAGATEFIEALPDGFDTVVGERGLTLSGGQRQRVALARAVVSDPRILVLDDATSAVDTTTEEQIHAALRSVMQGRTTILVAHRASTVQLAQRVVLIDDGRVVDEGTPAELLARSALYRSLLGDDEGDAAGSTSAATTTMTAPATVATVMPNGDHGGITPSAWPAVDATAIATVRPEAAGIGRTGPGSGGGVFGANLSATPELLAALDRLPQADDDPQVDLALAAAEPAEPFLVRRFVRPWRRGLVLGLVLVAVDAVLTALGPVLVRHGIDRGVTRGSTSVLWSTAIAFAVVTAFDWIATWAGAVVTGRTAERMLLALRVRIFAHLQRLSLDFYDNELDGRVMTRMTSDVEALSQLVQSGLVNAVVAAGTCIGVAVFLVLLSPALALATASVLPPLVAATWWYQRHSSRAYRDAREAIANVNANLQENLSGVRVSQAYGRERANADVFRKVSGSYLDARLRAQRLLALYFPGMGLLADLAVVVVLGAGAHLVSGGRTTPAVVIAFVLYLDLFFAPVQQLSQVFDTWQQAHSSTNKITELLTTASATPRPVDPVDPGVVRGAITFDDVHLVYSGTESEALTGVDLTIAPGETVALVGETGAGKSSVVKLVARYHDPTRGRVLIDGTDLRALDPAAFHRQLGVVPQEAFLFTGTIRDNIAYGRPSATDAEVEAAARAVGAHRFIATLPFGYRSEVSERGRSLSSGQRQLIALARAQLVEPAILLLDEATANLDLRSEAAVHAAMDAVSRPRTTLLVAHRLATARRADRIVVMHDGRIVEEGHHDELVAAGGRYAELWAASTAVADSPSIASENAATR